MSDADRIIRQNDAMDPARATALWRALGYSGDIGNGDALPPFFHQIYFWDVAPPDGLGRDGHPKVGGIIPDMGLPRRMWAGGHLTFKAPLLAGVPATRSTHLVSAIHKTGRTGPLGFVTLEHRFAQAGTVCVIERQDLVYREDHDPHAPRPKPVSAPATETEATALAFSSTLLFRYSALTMNGHRIHYDQDYARDVEGYDGLVVHGPLLAQLLMLACDTPDAPLRHFSFRGVSALMHTESVTLCRNGSAAWIRAGDGRLCMTATINQNPASAD